MLGARRVLELDAVRVALEAFPQRIFVQQAAHLGVVGVGEHRVAARELLEQVLVATLLGVEGLPKLALVVEVGAALEVDDGIAVCDLGHAVEELAVQRALVLRVLAALDLFGDVSAVAQGQDGQRAGEQGDRKDGVHHDGQDSHFVGDLVHRLGLDDGHDAPAKDVGRLGDDVALRAVEAYEGATLLRGGDGVAEPLIRAAREVGVVPEVVRCVVDVVGDDRLGREREHDVAVLVHHVAVALPGVDI